MRHRVRFGRSCFIALVSVSWVGFVPLGSFGCCVGWCGCGGGVLCVFVGVGVGGSEVHFGACGCVCVCGGV